VVAQAGAALSYDGRVKSPLLDVAKAFLSAKRWAFDQAKNEPVLRLGFVGKTARWPCFIEAKEPLGQLVFFSVRDQPVPGPKRAAVAELAMRINVQLNVGAFELNFDDGIFRLRSGIDVEGHGLDAALMSNLALLNVATMDKYLPALEAVLNGESPQRALASVTDTP
jgi:hypothetical protein